MNKKTVGAVLVTVLVTALASPALALGNAGSMPCIDGGGGGGGGSSAAKRSPPRAVLEVGQGTGAVGAAAVRREGERTLKQRLEALGLLVD